MEMEKCSIYKCKGSYLTNNKYMFCSDPDITSLRDILCSHFYSNYLRQFNGTDPKVSFHTKKLTQYIFKALFTEVSSFR